jgi:hypothetical protein
MDMYVEDGMLWWHWNWRWKQWLRMIVRHHILAHIIHPCDHLILN